MINSAVLNQMRYVKNFRRRRERLENFSRANMERHPGGAGGSLWSLVDCTGSSNGVVIARNPIYQAFPRAAIERDALQRASLSLSLLISALFFFTPLQLTLPARAGQGTLRAIRSRTSSRDILYAVPFARGMTIRRWNVSALSFSLPFSLSCNGQHHFIARFTPTFALVPTRLRARSDLFAFRSCGSFAYKSMNDLNPVAADADPHGSRMQRNAITYRVPISLILRTVIALFAAHHLALARCAVELALAQSRQIQTSREESVA